MTDLKPIEDQIAEIDKKLSMPLPTPPVGTMVVWYDRADARKGGEIAALVVSVEGPGKVALTIFRPFNMPTHKRGSLHVTHEVHLTRHNSVSQNSGAWDYPDGQKAPKFHYDLHIQELQGRKSALEQQLAEAKVVLAKESGKRLATT